MPNPPTLQLYKNIFTGDGYVAGQSLDTPGGSQIRIYEGAADAPFGSAVLLTTLVTGGGGAFTAVFSPSRARHNIFFTVVDSGTMIESPPAGPLPVKYKQPTLNPMNPGDSSISGTMSGEVTPGVVVNILPFNTTTVPVGNNWSFPVDPGSDQTYSVQAGDPTDFSDGGTTYPSDVNTGTSSPSPPPPPPPDTPFPPRKPWAYGIKPL